MISPLINDNFSYLTFKNLIPEPSVMSSVVERVPKGPSEVTSDWLQARLMENIPKAASVRVKSMEPEKSPSGYLSAAFRATADVTKSDGSTEQIKTFIKIMPSDDDHKDCSHIDHDF